MRKTSKEMFLHQELKTIFGHRVRSKDFRDNYPVPFIVSFHVLSNIVGENPLASRFYSFIINKAIEGIRFYCNGEEHSFSSVNYMFIDSNSICVAVTNDGTDLSLCNRPDKRGYMKIITKKLVTDLKVSAEEMKAFFMEHYKEFPYLITFSKIIDRYFTRSEINSNISLLASCLKVNEWVKVNLIDVLRDLNNLVSRSHFYLV